MQPDCASERHVEVDMQNPNSHYIVYEKTDNAGFHIFFGERKDGRQLDPARPINGTSIQYRPDRKEVEIVADEVGAEYLFYKEDQNSILLSNRLDNLVKVNDTPNWSAIQCFLSFGYTLKSDTFFNDIKKTLPYEKISIDTYNLKLTKLLYSPKPKGNIHTTEPEAVRLFSKRLSEILNDYEPMVLMMSAGWDSRTLLAPRNSPVTAAYTHGDLSSRETTIAKKLTGHARRDHLFRDVKNLNIDNELLDEIIELNGHCLWPIWHVSSRIAARAYELPITSGVIGARVGGHNGFPSMGSRSQKIINSLHLVSPKLVTKEKILRDLEGILKAPERFWFTSQTGHQLFEKTRPQCNEELHETLKEYLGSHGDFSAAIENFNYDHVSRQYMMKQPSMARGALGYYSPLSHPDLLNLAYSVPFKSRLHNTLSRKIIKALNPDLLQFPMAATLTKAKSPIWVQELSRIVRIVIERAAIALNRNRPNLGWFNYEHLYQSDVLNEVVDSLHSKLWSQERMKSVLSRNPENGVDAGSTLDMLCKIKTVDYYLSLSRFDSTISSKSDQKYAPSE